MGVARFLLRFGILIPLLFWGAVFAAAYFYPGFNHFTQYVNELGAASSPRAVLFNYGLMAAGAVAVVTSIGLMLGVGLLGRNWIAALLGGAAFAAWGVATVMTGLYPTPDARHLFTLWQSPFGRLTLDMVVVLSPLLLLWGLSKATRTVGTKFMLFVGFAASAGLLAVIFGAGGLNARVEPGLLQRAWLAVVTVWPALVSMGLAGRLADKQRSDRRRAALAAQASHDTAPRAAIETHDENHEPRHHAAAAPAVGAAAAPSFGSVEHPSATYEPAPVAPAPAPAPEPAHVPDPAPAPTVGGEPVFGSVEHPAPAFDAPDSHAEPAAAPAHDASPEDAPRH